MLNSQSLKTKKLGVAQLGCLENLGKGWTWRYGWRNGWVWDTAGGTKRILDRLVASGLAVCVNGEYSISESGKNQLASMNTNRISHAKQSGF